MPLDEHSKRALIEAAKDLTTAALATVERIAEDPHGDPVERTLKVYDYIWNTIRELRTV